MLWSLSTIYTYRLLHTTISENRLLYQYIVALISISPTTTEISMFNPFICTFDHFMRMSRYDLQKPSACKTRPPELIRFCNRNIQACLVQRASFYNWNFKNGIKSHFLRYISAMIIHSSLKSFYLRFVHKFHQVRQRLLIQCSFYSYSQAFRPTYYYDSKVYISMCLCYLRNIQILWERM